MHEVMSGSFFTPQRESVPEQTWSSSAFLSAAIHGMLGLESEGRKDGIAPASLERDIPTGNTHLSIPRDGPNQMVSSNSKTISASHF
jgi:hypothetical protein